jgi:hypothetical protein
MQNGNETENLKPISTREWIPLYEYNNDKIYQIYEEALDAADCRRWDNYLKRLRHHSLIQLVYSNIKTLGTNYNFVECGCWLGQSTFEISYVLNQHNFSKNFFVFDSFEGLSEITDNDKSPLRKNTDKSNLKVRKHFASNFDLVSNTVKDFSFTTLHQGWIPEVFNTVEIDKIQFLHIDVDLYQPTYDSLDFFFSKLVEGGIIVCDDYNATKWPGAKKAWDDFFKNKKTKLNYQVPLGSSFIIK